jgi:hypothetical protein
MKLRLSIITLFLSFNFYAMDNSHKKLANKSKQEKWSHQYMPLIDRHTGHTFNYSA